MHKRKLRDKKEDRKKQHSKKLT